MKNTGNRKRMLQHPLLKGTGAIFLAGLLLALVTVLTALPAHAELESRLRLVYPGKCAECHPNNGGTGKCNLVDDHKERARCLECHSTCTDGTPPPDYDHFTEDLCFDCHRLEKIHKKHEQRGYDCSECHTGKKILVVVDSKHGTTAQYADILGNELIKKGFQVDVGRAHKMLQDDISGYDGAVIGSPTYWGFPLKDLREFLATNAAIFQTIPTAYLYNSLEGAETGNVSSKAFWQFAYHPVLSQYPEIFPLESFLLSQVPPNGECDLTFNPASGMPAYANCDAPAWVGLMPGSWNPRIGFPVEYMPMELFGFGGYKPHFRAGAAVEYAQNLVDISFFDGACGPGNVSPTVTAEAAPTSGTQPLEVTFTAAASDPDGTIQTYLWTFGDGAASDQPNPVHTYVCSGTYTATVKVTDNNCGIAVSSVEITVGSAGGPISFTCDVAPVLAQHCNDCHGTGGGLSTSTCEGLAQGGNSGPAVIPGNKEASLLYQTMTGGSPAMPPTTTMPAEDIAVIGEWIDSLDPTCAPSELCSCPIIPAP